MKLLAVFAISLATTTITDAFVPMQTSPARRVDTARPVLKQLNVESFLNKAKTEFEKFMGVEQAEKDDKQQTTTTTFQQATKDATKQGGNARYQNPTVIPSKLEDECAEVIVDFSTGDELCWGESPLSSRKNYQHTANPVATNTAMQYDIATRDEYHKGGNAHYVAETLPRALEDECDEEHRYIDFQSGDELCYAD